MIAFLSLISSNLIFDSIEALEKPRPFFNSKMKFKGIGICHQSMFFPGKLIRNEKYDLSYKIAADYDLAYRLWRKGTEFLYRDITIAKYDWGKGISSNPYKLLDVYRENARVCHQQLNPLYWGTFAVNILGSLLIGLLVALVGKGIVSNEIKLLLVTGFCGGFTTFSTFANESFGMMKTGDVLLFAVYVGASVFVGIFAVWCGLKLVGG